jgi:hypothetical protein
MSAHDGLPRTKFGDIEFPGEVTHLRLVFRHHVHEYPHSPGGSPEKLGRGLYRVSITAQFHDRFPLYPGLYPDALNRMRGYAELGATLTLRHPTVGEFPAFITSWDQVKSGKVRSGEQVEIEFLEDQSASFALTAISELQHLTAVGPTAQQLATDLAATQKDLTLSANDISIFAALQTAANAVVALKDTSLLYGNRYVAAVAQMINLCQQIDALPSMQDARAWPVIDTLRELWALGVDASNDAQAQQVKMSTYIVPYTQSVIEIAIALFGDASKQTDILSLNPIDDPSRVLAGTRIRYYPPTPQQRLAA